MASVLSRIQIIMEANTARYNNELRRARENSSSTFGKIAKGAGKMALASGAAIVAVGASALRTAGSFEAAMNGVSAVSGATGEDFTRLRDLAKEMGSSTAFSATEAANGMEFLAMAGMNTEQVLSTIPNALNLAAAGSLDLASSADILSNIMTGMGLSAEESGRAADVLAQAASKSNVDIRMLGESMKYVAPISKQLGMSLEETTAMVGALGNAGIQGSEAGTALRSVYARFATHSKALGHFKDMGISIKDASGEMKSMTTLVGELAVGMKDMGADERLAVFKEMAGTEAMSALAVTVDAMADGSLPKLTKELESSEGAAKRMADTRMEGLEGAFKGLASAWEGFQIELADGGALTFASTAVNVLADGMRTLTQNLPEIITNFKQFVDNAGLVDLLTDAWDNLVSVIERAGEIIKPVIDFFREHDKLSEALAISIGLVAGAFIVYNAAVVVGTAVTGAFVAVLALVTSPIFLIVAAMVALTAAGVYLYQNWDTLKAKAVEIWGSIKTYVSNKIEETKQAVIDKFNSMKDRLFVVLDVLKIQAKARFEYIKNTIITTLKELPSRMLQIGKDIVNGLINGIKQGASGVATAIGSMASSAVAKAKSVLDIRSPSRVMKKVGEQTAEGMANGIKKGKKAVVTEAQKMAEQAIETVKNSIASLQKEIALFGNDSPLASFNFDVSIGKFAGVPDSLLDKNRELITQKMRLIELDKQQAESAKLLAKARESIQERFAQLEKAKETSSDGLDKMLGGIEQETPMGKIQADYEQRLEVVRQFEQLHTDEVQKAAEARMAVEQSYQDAKRNLMLTQGESLFGDLAGMAKSFAGEQSGIYRALFAVEKGFAIAQSAIAIQQSVAKAMALGFPQNIPVIAQTIGMGVSLLGNIKSIAMPVGQAHDGIANIPREGTWVLDKNERVVKADDNKKLSRFLDNTDSYHSKTAPVINMTIENHAGVPVSHRVDDDGRIRVIVGQELNKQLPQQVNDEYSQFNKALKNNYHLQRNLG